VVSDFFFLEGWGELTDGAFRFLREGGMVRCCGKGGWHLLAVQLYIYREIEMYVLHRVFQPAALHSFSLCLPKTKPERPGPYDVTIRCGKSTRLH